MAPKTIVVWVGLIISLLITTVTAQLWSPCHHPCLCQSILLATEESVFLECNFHPISFLKIPEVLSCRDKTILHRAYKVPPTGPQMPLPLPYSTSPAMACFHPWPLHMVILYLKYPPFQTVPTCIPISVCLLSPNPSPSPPCSSISGPMKLPVHLPLLAWVLDLYPSHLHTGLFYCEGS